MEGGGNPTTNMLSLNELLILQQALALIQGVIAAIALLIITKLKE